MWEIEVEARKAQDQTPTLSNHPSTHWRSNTTAPTDDHTAPADHTPPTDASILKRMSFDHLCN